MNLKNNVTSSLMTWTILRYVQAGQGEYENGPIGTSLTTSRGEFSLRFD